MANKDPFTGIAIRFVLGVVLGFSLLVLGLLFLFLSLLSAAAPTTDVPSSGYLLMGLLSMVIGSTMMYVTLKGSPQPGSLK